MGERRANLSAGQWLHWVHECVKREENCQYQKWFNSGRRLTHTPIGYELMLFNGKDLWEHHDAKLHPGTPWEEEQPCSAELQQPPLPVSTDEPRDTEARNQGQPSVFGQPSSNILRASPLTPPDAAETFDDLRYMPEISESDSGSQRPIEPLAP